MPRYEPRSIGRTTDTLANSATPALYQDYKNVYPSSRANPIMHKGSKLKGKLTNLSRRMIKPCKKKIIIILGHFTPNYITLRISF
jgi:hypothetical protein